ncbi:hypothetical protein IK112_03215 [Candidatus Saccharibacteria bacterium]|nr:hypothetical protein [Candidatus Saccharibacteria bacterium]
MRKRHLLAIAITIACSFAAGLFWSHPTYASTDSINKKWFFAQYYNCILNGNIQTSLVNPKSRTTASEGVFIGGDMLIPSVGLAGTDANSATCTDIYRGSDSFLGANKALGVLEWNGNGYESLNWDQYSEVANMLKDTGYTINPTGVWQFNMHATESNTIGICFDPSFGNAVVAVWESLIEKKLGVSFFNHCARYTVKQKDESTATIEAKSEGGKTTYRKVTSNWGSEFAISVKNNDSSAELGIVLKPDLSAIGGGNKIFTANATLPRTNNVENDVNGAKNAIVSALNDGQEWQSGCGLFGNIISKILSSINPRAVYYETQCHYEFDIDNPNKVVDAVDDGGSYTYNESLEAGATYSLNKLGGFNNVSNLYLDEEEEAELYSYYLDSSIPEGVSLTCNSNNTSLTEVHLKSSGVWKKYYVNLSGVDLSTPKYNVPNTDSITFRTINLQEVINWLNSHPAENTSDDDCPDPDKTIKPRKDSEGLLGLQECFNGADALGWILCPVIKFLHATVQNIYDSIIEPFLQVNVSAFDTSSGTFQGWQVFQGVANVLFVILFLFVIFSQVTGIGIDNYGIKRILPKLIVTAILINISYFICQLLVDASNILGAGLEGVFSGIKIDSASVSTGQSALTTAITGLIGTISVGGAVATAGMWAPALIVPLLLGLITILFSVAFMFILLGVRQAGVIILVVVAPVAFVCYMLPNTKPIFDKWKKMLEGLLMLYPICGALIGGSALASKILTSSSNNFFMHLLAALLTVVPFFFVPKLLQGAFSAMGNIGGKISAMGSNLGKRAGGAVANSQAVKDAQLRAAAGVNSRGEATAMGKRMDKIARGKSIFSRVPGMQRAASRSMARGRAAYLKDYAEQQREDRLNTEGYMESAIAEQDAQLDAEQVATEQAKIESSKEFVSGEYGIVANDMVELMKSDKNGNNSAKIRAIQNALNKIGDDGRSAMGTAMEGLNFADVSNEARQAWASNLLGAHAADFKNNARSQYEAAKANVGKNPVGNYTEFAAGGARAPRIDSYRPEQFANMDDGEFARIMKDFNNMQELRDNKDEWGKLSGEAQNNINKYIEGIQRLAHSTYTDPNLRSSLKGSREKNLASLAAGYNTSRIDIDHSSSNTESSTELLDNLMQQAGENNQNNNPDNGNAAS